MGAGALRLRAAAMTHPGKVRPNNEDHIAIGPWVFTGVMDAPESIECPLDEPRLCVVADGLGGHASGEIASELAVRHLCAAASRMTDAQAVSASLVGASEHLFDRMGSARQLSGMATTVVGIAAFGGDVWLFNVGDSRGYVTAETSSLRLWSTDDIEIRSQRPVDPSARTGLNTGGLTQALGGSPFSFEQIEPHVVHRDARPGDRYLLCSDGLTDMLDLAAIERCLTEDIAASTRRLVAAALAAGGDDNVSVILVDLLDPSSAQ